MSEKRRTTVEEAKRVGDEIGVDWSSFDLEHFRQGMDVEFEHGSHDPQTIRYADARRGVVVLDANASEVSDLASKGRKQARRGRPPKSAT